MKDAIEREKRAIDELKSKKSGLEDKRSRSSDEDEKNRLGKDIEQLEKDIYEAGKRLDQAIAALEARKKLVDDAIYTIGKCMDYRRAVMNVFAAAQDNVRGENDEQIQPIARFLRDYYEKSKKGHEIAISDKKNALDTCNDSRP